MNKEALRELTTSVGWRDMKTTLDKMIDEWQKNKLKKTSEFETIYNMALMDGKVEGTMELIRTIEKQAE